LIPFLRDSFCIIALFLAAAHSHHRTLRTPMQKACAAAAGTCR
jgi:hypothetical protein